MKYIPTEVCNGLLNLVHTGINTDCSRWQMSAAKRKDDQKVKDQGKKEDHKTKKARIDAKKDTVRLSKSNFEFELIVSVLLLLSPLYFASTQARVDCEGLEFP